MSIVARIITAIKSTVQAIAQVFSSRKRLMYGYLGIQDACTLILNHSGREFTPFAKEACIDIKEETTNDNQSTNWW